LISTTASNNLTFQRNIWSYVLLTAALFIASLIAGLLASIELANTNLEELKQALQPLIQTLGVFGPIAFLFVIFLNNAIKALAAIVLGVFAGIPPILFILVNGFMIGLVVSALQSSMGYGIVVASLLPHGIIEVPLLVLASALGVSVGKESLRYLLRKQSSIKIQLRHGMRVYLKWIVAGLFIAAVIEVFITPLVIMLAGGKEFLLP
jgi:stage II sporulation protein M